MNLKYLSLDYIPKGELEGFPLEVIDKMIERQVEQNNEANVEVFEDENECNSLLGGFWWRKTIEGKSFWDKVILERKFDIFFEKYPKEKELPLPRVIEVRDGVTNKWQRRVCFMFKNGKAICWTFAKTLKDAEKECDTYIWNEWREIEEEKKEEYKPFDFSDGVKNHLDLIGKKMFFKESKHIQLITDLRYDESCGVSTINNIDTENLFKNYNFEDGSPVGLKVQK